MVNEQRQLAKGFPSDKARNTFPSLYSIYFVYKASVKRIRPWSKLKGREPGVVTSLDTPSAYGVCSLKPNDPLSVDGTNK